MTLWIRKMILVLNLVFLISARSAFGADAEITDDSWEKILVGEWMVKFYAPWCPACRALESTWSELASWSPRHNVHVGSVDVTKEAALNGRFMITSLPTIYHVKEGQFRVFSGSRSLEDLQAFIENESWKEIAPVPEWKSPNSLLMRSVSSLFAMSTHLRNLQEHVSNEFGLPDWAVLILFAVSTVIVGLILGVLLILLGDWLWQPRVVLSQKFDGDSGSPETDHKNKQSPLSSTADSEESETNELRKRKGLAKGSS